MNVKRRNSSLENAYKRIKSGDNIVTVEASDQMQTIFVNEEKTSWIKIVKVPIEYGLTMAEFEQMWALKPEEKHKIKIMGRVISCPRFTKSYLKPYNFSGLINEADMNFPDRFKQLLKYSHEMNPELNQSLVNWYEYDGSIGKHSDDIRQLKPDSDIFSYSFGPAIRNFILEPKKKDSTDPIFHIKLGHNTLVIMGGKCQTTHLHHVPKMQSGDSSSGRRLNITFRCFK